MIQVSSVPVWSASPTPLSCDLTIDVPSVGRMVRDALANGIDGLFLAGTCGEGPWLPDTERARLVRAVVAEANGKLKIAVQVTDNSVPRILNNIQQAADAGADIAIIAPPLIFMNATPDRVAGLFIEAADASSLPVGIYDLGAHRSVMIPEEKLMEIYLRPNVQMVKDSSGAPSRRAIALAARKTRRGLSLFNGDEFRCLEYLEAGYDGFMFGGAAAVGPKLNRIAALYARGQLEEARQVDEAMKKVLLGIYGGKDIACWLTGLKYYMVRRGLFSSTAGYLDYPLTAECRSFVEDYAAQTAETDKSCAAQ